MAKVTKSYPADSVVERAIIICETAQNLIFKLESNTGKKIVRQTFQGWRKRHAFSRAWILPVHRITRIPMTDLVMALEKSTHTNQNDTFVEAAEILEES